MNNVDFERSKIYEKLDYNPEPEGYKGKLPWKIQQQIAATNGIQYADCVGKLKDYPRYELPVQKTEAGIMLDIGTGWGRWLVAGSDKGYIPVGVDLRLEFCEAAKETMLAAGINGYTVVADLKDLPFKSEIFDLVWSFSVIQHTHKDRLLSCLDHIQRILTPNGFAKLEFPNKDGFRNKRGPVKQFAQFAEDYDSWVVRYYSIDEYQAFFRQRFGNFAFTNHSFFGIGVLKEDLKYVSLKNKLLCAISLTGSALAKIIPGLKYKADSIYVTAIKTSGENNLEALEKFQQAHGTDPTDNLNIVHLLQCPVTEESLLIADDRSFVFTQNSLIKYPVKNNIPVLIASEVLS